MFRALAQRSKNKPKRHLFSNALQRSSKLLGISTMLLQKELSVNDDSNSESCSIFVPHGFAEGRELPTVAQVMPQQRSKSALLMRSLCTMYSTNSTATPSRFSGSRFVSSLLTSALHYTSLFYSDATSLSHTQTHTNKGAANSEPRGRKMGRFRNGT